MDKVAAVVHSMWPGVPLVPTMATGYSDDRQTRNAGDESVEFTYRLIKAMSRLKGP